METFTESLSFDGQIVPGNQIIFDEQLVPYHSHNTELTEFVPNSDKSLLQIPKVRTFAQELTQKVKSFTSSLKSNGLYNQIKQLPEVEINQPFGNSLEKSKQQAQLCIQQVLSAAQIFNDDIQYSLTSVPAHPYDRLVYQYLGPNFVCPTIYELNIPQNYCPKEAVKEIINVKNDLFDLQMTHLAAMSAEVMDTNFYGITSQNLNNAFAVLSTTCDGDQYIINDKKLSEHLSFVETLKSIPTDYIEENSMEVAQKLIARFIEIQKM